MESYGIRGVASVAIKSTSANTFFLERPNSDMDIAVETLNVSGVRRHPGAYKSTLGQLDDGSRHRS
jgi:hypothetical protein